MKRIYKSQRRGRALYFAGMYSLIFLPVLSIGYLAIEGTFKRYSVLEVIIWDPQLHYDHPDLFHYEFHPDIEFVEYTLTGNKEQDTEILHLAKQEIIELQNTRNTSKGVHFHFGEKAKYWSWIEANDLCSYERTGLLKSVYNNEMWVFNIQPRIATDNESKGKEDSGLDSDTRLLCGTCSGMSCGIRDDFQGTNEILAERALKREFILRNVKLLAVPGLLFVIMIFFTVKRLREDLK